MQTFRLMCTHVQLPGCRSPTAPADVASEMRVLQSRHSACAFGGEFMLVVRGREPCPFGRVHDTVGDGLLRCLLSPCNAMRAQRAVGNIQCNPDAYR